MRLDECRWDWQQRKDSTIRPILAEFKRMTSPQQYNVLRHVADEMDIGTRVSYIRLLWCSSLSTKPCVLQVLRAKDVFARSFFIFMFIVFKIKCFDTNLIALYFIYESVPWHHISQCINTSALNQIEFGRDSVTLQQRRLLYHYSVIQSLLIHTSNLHQKACIIIMLH